MKFENWWASKGMVTIDEPGFALLRDAWDAAIASTVELGAWQPIETAPRDRYVLLFTPDEPDWYGNMEVGKWFGDDDGCWWSCGGPNGGLELNGAVFTHWMPLPKAPNARNERLPEAVRSIEELGVDRRRGKMAKALPRKWFPGHGARVVLRKVDKWAEGYRGITPYFDTWEEAHAHMLSKAEARLSHAKRELASAIRHKSRIIELQRRSA